MKKIISLLFALSLLIPKASFSQDEDPNKKILKDAIVGAVTGAVASEASKNDANAQPTASAVKDALSSSSDKESDKDDKVKKNFGKKKKNKKRPHGWDQGKKTGWGDGDVPPGLRDK